MTQAKDHHEYVEQGRWQVTIDGQDMGLEAFGENRPVAGFPGRPERIAAHPNRDDWAGSAGWFVTIVRLERS
jgi:hypothetical protein